MMKGMNEVMPTIESSIHEVIERDANGNETYSKQQFTKKVKERSNEPDYIKIYTNMWCAANQIPDQYRELFLQLAIRMTYAQAVPDADETDGENAGGQIVATGGPNAVAIMKALKWTSKRMYQYGLRALKQCNAIRQISRGWYQINPQYAGRGEWKYNPQKDRGGIENIIGYFDLQKKQMSAKIIWADDGTDTEMNEAYRQGLHVKPNEAAMLTEERGQIVHPETAAQPSDNPPDAAAKAAPTKPKQNPSLSAHPTEQTPPQAIVCPGCGESVEPHEYRDQRPGHAGEKHLECPLCGADLDGMKGAVSA